MLGHASRWLSPYAEGVLPAPQAGRVAHHVLGCRRCRRKLETVRTGVRFAAALRPVEGGSPPSWGSLAPLLDAPPARGLFPFSLRWAVAAVAVVALAAGSLLWRSPSSAGTHELASLEDAALTAHRSAALDVHSTNARLLRGWIAERSGFSLPDHAAGLEGAAFLSLGTGEAVVVAARLGGEPVTLLVSEAAVPGAATGPKRISTRIAGGLSVASWTRGTRSYALVSPLRAEAACTICHAGPAALL